MDILGVIKSIASQVQSVKSGVGYADIVLSVDNFGDSIIFPVVPAELPQLETPQKNENFEGVLIDLTVIGNLACKRIQWEGLLPSSPSKYPFCRPNGDTADRVINFIKRYQAEFTPLRLTISFTNGVVYTNMLCLVNNFKSHRDNVGDYHYNIELIEYRDVGTGGVYL